MKFEVRGKKSDFGLLYFMKKYFYIIIVMIFAQHLAVASKLSESDSISPATERQAGEIAKKFIKEHRTVNFIQPTFILPSSLNMS